MSKQQILALVTDAFGGRGGIAQYNRDLLGSLAGNSHIAVLPRNAPDPVELLPDGIKQLKAQASRVGYALAALRLAITERPGVIFCGHLFMAPLAALVARIARAKLIVQLHGIEAWEQPPSLQRAAVEDANLVLCVSRDTRAKVLSWAAMAPERAVVLPNTVSDVFVPGDHSAARARFGLGKETVLLSVGRLDSREQYKGHDRVIKALSDVMPDRDVIYLIAGDGDDRLRLERLARERGVAARVRFLGLVPADDLPELYRAADLFVLPSTGEGFGIVFLEAMASGTPAIGLSVAGAKDALVDGQLGIATEPERFANELADAIDRARPDSRILAEAVRSRFQRPNFCARAEALVEQLVA